MEAKKKQILIQLLLTAIIVSIYSTSHIFMISHISTIYAFFSVDTMFVNKREVTVQRIVS